MCTIYAIISRLLAAFSLMVAMLLFCPQAFAYSLVLEWEPNSEPDLAGYIVYYGTARRDYDYDVDIGNQTSCIISGLLEEDVYYFAVTAYDLDGNESIFSTEVIYPQPQTSNPISGSGGGGGGCFVAAAACDLHPPIWLLVLCAGLLLIGIALRLFNDKTGEETATHFDF